MPQEVIRCSNPSQVIPGRTVLRGTPDSRLAEESGLQGQLEIFNTDQGSQFTGEAFTRLLRQHGVRISMDGKGSYDDNLFIERLWRTVKYEEVYLKSYQRVPEVRAGIGAYFRFYNEERPHPATWHRPRYLHQPR